MDEQAPKSGPFSPRMTCAAGLLATCLCLLVYTPAAMAQPVVPPPQPIAKADMGGQFTLEARSRERALIAEVREPELTLEVEPRTSKIIRTRKPVARLSITHPQILEVVQFGPMEFEMIGLTPGETSLTLWFADADGQAGREMLRYMVRVAANELAEDRRKIEYAALERRATELFPNSLIHLFPVGDKLIVRGQARDSREAGEILQFLGGAAGDLTWAGGPGTTRVGAYGGGYGGWGGGGGGYGGYGGAGYGGWNGVGYGTNNWGANGRSGLGPNIINMLDVPGEKQVLLRVRVAELSRTALREIGSKLNLHFGDFSFSSNLGVSGVFQAVLSTDDVGLTMTAVSSNSYSKILAEPNLVTLSGHPANFVVGGQFAVPTIVGVQGAAAVTANWQQYGTLLQFTPTVLDKDRIRLEVSPTFSTLDNSAGATVNGIPGLLTRQVNTTVDLREGQWLAIAGLIQDQQQGYKNRVPYLGDIPFLDFFFSQRHVERDETEVLILVSPDLVHPLEPEEAPWYCRGWK